jgi:hypothetical protein
MGTEVIRPAVEEEQEKVRSDSSITMNFEMHMKYASKFENIFR